MDDMEKSLFNAITGGNLDKVKSLLTKKPALINARGSTMNYRDMTPLHCAARAGHKKVVKYLLDAGADVDAKDDKGNTSLHIACRGNYVEMIKLLTDRGAYVNTRNDQGQTSLHLHMLCSDWERQVTDFLITKGADLNAKDKDGDTLLHDMVHWSRSDRL